MKQISPVSKARAAVLVAGNATAIAVTFLLFSNQLSVPELAASAAGSCVVFTAAVEARRYWLRRRPGPPRC